MLLVLFSFLLRLLGTSERHVYGFLCISIPHSWILLFSFPSFLPPLSLQAHKMHDLFTIGSGEALLHLIPPPQCHAHCSILVTPIGPGDIGRRAQEGGVSHGVFCF